MLLDNPRSTASDSRSLHDQSILTTALLKAVDASCSASARAISSSQRYSFILSLRHGQHIHYRKDLSTTYQGTALHGFASLVQRAHFRFGSMTKHSQGGLAAKQRSQGKDAYTLL